jgi:hypothetical protein
LIALFAAVAFCQEPIDEDKAIVEETRVGKRGLSLGLGSTGFDGYNNYLTPSTRGLYNTRQYNPVSEYGNGESKIKINCLLFLEGLQAHSPRLIMLIKNNLQHSSNRI